MVAVGNNPTKMYFEYDKRPEILLRIPEGRYVHFGR